MPSEPPIPVELWEQAPPAAQAALLAVPAGQERRLAELQAQVNDLRQRLNSNSTNSSKPPSSDGPQVAEAASAQLRAQMRALAPRPDRLYVAWGCCFPYERLLPFDSLRRMRPMKIFGLGCATNTPLMDERLREFGIADLVTALYTRDDVYLICEPGLFSLLQTYIAEHRAVRVQACPVFDPGTPAAFKVFRVRPVEARGGGVPRAGAAACQGRVRSTEPDPEGKELSALSVRARQSARLRLP
jgi:hypothetical protein